EGGREAEGSYGEAGKVVHTAVIHSEGCVDRNVVEVASELHVVPADGPGKIVFELISLLDALNVGVRLATEIGVTGDIHGWIGAAWDLGVVEIYQTSASVLKEEVIHFAAAEGPGILHDAGHIAVGLLRSSGVGVLTERLILAIDFYPGNRARADIGAQREAVVVAHVVVDAKRVQAGALEDGKVADLRIEILK